MKLFLHVLAYLHMLILLGLVAFTGYSVYKYKIDRKRIEKAVVFLREGKLPEKPPEELPQDQTPGIPATISEEMLRRREWEIQNLIKQNKISDAGRVVKDAIKKMREESKLALRDVNQKIQEWRALNEQYKRKEAKLEKERESLLAEKNNFQDMKKKFFRDRADKGIEEWVLTIQQLDPEDAYQEIKHINNPWKLYLIFQRLKNDFAAQLLLQFVNGEPQFNTFQPRDLPARYSVFANKSKNEVIEKFISAGGFPLERPFDPPSKNPEKTERAENAEK